jgi:hypothetical protein
MSVRVQSTFQVSKRSGFYPCPAVDTASSNVGSQAGGVLLTETVRAVALDQELSTALTRWRHPNAVHDPAKIVLDLAVTLALGGDCLADIAVLRAEPGLFGPVASDPTVSRAIDRLADDPVAALRAINTARAAARARAWSLAGGHAPDHRSLVVPHMVRLVVGPDQRKVLPERQDRGAHRYPADQVHHDQEVGEKSITHWRDSELWRGRLG